MRAEITDLQEASPQITEEPEREASEEPGGCAQEIQQKPVRPMVMVCG